MTGFLQRAAAEALSGPGKLVQVCQPGPAIHKQDMSIYMCIYQNHLLFLNSCLIWERIKINILYKSAGSSTLWRVELPAFGCLFYWSKYLARQPQSRRSPGPPSSPDRAKGAAPLWTPGPPHSEKRKSDSKFTLSAKYNCLSTVKLGYTHFYRTAILPRL